MPHVDREMIGNQANWAASRYNSMIASASSIEKSNAQAELLVSQFWQEVSSDHDSNQVLFDTMVDNWNQWCITHAVDPVPPNFLYIEGRIRDIERIMVIDTTSYNTIADKVDAEQTAKEQSDLAAAKKMLESIDHPKMPDLQEEDPDKEYTAADNPVVPIDPPNPQEPDTKTSEGDPKITTDLGKLRAGKK